MSNVQIIRLESEQPSECWTIEKGKSFAYRFVDASGKEQGRFRDPDVMAEHFVSALQRIDAYGRRMADLAMFAGRLLDPEDLGHAVPAHVPAHVRDAARVALGMLPVEEGR